MKLRYFFADLSARITFSFPTGMVIEMLVSGMTLQQSLLSRVTNLPVVMLMARPYGIYRDWVLTRLYATDRTKHLVLWVLLNMVTYATFHIPQYAIILLLEGVAPLQIAKASATIALMSPVLGAAFGYWLELFRHGLFRIQREEKL
ncbi:MAG: L-alanine exporter AlaE [Candidatus Gracilibacteria bacterium]